jgi:hypothetical protein
MSAPGVADIEGGTSSQTVGGGGGGGTIAGNGYEYRPAIETSSAGDAQPPLSSIIRPYNSVHPLEMDRQGGPSDKVSPWQLRTGITAALLSRLPRPATTL